eukprot:symbB.v1.2.028110.t1/scaffold2945.1/size66705/1
MRQAVHLRVELEREQAKNPELKQLLKAEAEAMAAAQGNDKAAAKDGPKIPRPAAFDAGKDSGKGAQRGLFGPAGSGNPGGGLFGLPSAAPQRFNGPESRLQVEPRAELQQLQQTMKPTELQSDAPRGRPPLAVQRPVMPPTSPQGPSSPSGIDNLGQQDADRRRRQHEEMRRVLEEQIAQKERQKLEVKQREDLNHFGPGSHQGNPPQHPRVQELNPREARLQSRALERLREKEREVLEAESNARQMPEGSDQRAEMLRHALQLRVLC